VSTLPAGIILLSVGCFPLAQSANLAKFGLFAFCSGVSSGVFIVALLKNCCTFPGIIN
jgi:hypothetical protein